MEIKRKLEDSWKRLKQLNHLDENMRFEIHRTNLERSLLDNSASGITEELFADAEVIVSLTSFGQRIEQVHLTVESLLRQTRKPNRLILWLADSEKDKPLPAALELQCARGLEVRYTQDTRSYKKLIPTLREFPDAIIITADDDCMYDVAMVDRLVRGHSRYPNAVIANTALQMLSDRPMRDWKLSSESDTPRMFIMPVGQAGVLYPPHSLAPETCDEEKFMRLCPTTDDIWFRMMGIRMNSPVVRVTTPSSDGWTDPVHNPEAQKVSLWKVNVIKDLNSQQCEAALQELNIIIFPE